MVESLPSPHVDIFLVEGGLLACRQVLPPAVGAKGFLVGVFRGHIPAGFPVRVLASSMPLYVNRKIRNQAKSVYMFVSIVMFPSISYKSNLSTSCSRDLGEVLSHVLTRS